MSQIPDYQFKRKTLWEKLKNFCWAEASFHNRRIFAILTVFGSLTGIIGLSVSSYTLISPIQSIKAQIADIKYDYPKVFNEQVPDFSGLDPEEIIRQYYDSANLGDYQTACSFLSTQLCTLYDVQEFTKWVNDKKRLLTVKNKDGENLGKVWFSGETLPNTNSEIWCGEVFFQANYEEDVIRQVWQYTVAERPDENYEIRRMLCEFGEKRGEDRSVQMGCNVQPKYCLNSFLN